MVVAVMQASEAALRQAGLHHSAGDFERLLRNFLRSRRGRLQGEMPVVAANPGGDQLLALPRRPRSGTTPRRIPGLHTGVRSRQD